MESYADAASIQSVGDHGASQKNGVDVLTSDRSTTVFLTAQLLNMVNPRDGITSVLFLVLHSVVVDGILMVERFVVRCWEFLQPRRGTQCGKSAPVLFSALRSQSTSADVLARKGTVHRSSDLLLRVGRLISLCQM